MKYKNLPEGEKVLLNLEQQEILSESEDIIFVGVWKGE